MQIIKNPAYFLKIQEKRITHPDPKIREDAFQKLVSFACDPDNYFSYPVKLVCKARRIVSTYYYNK